MSPLLPPSRASQPRPSSRSWRGLVPRETLIVTLALVATLAACATPKPDAETLAAAQRTYQGVTAEQVLDAAAEVIELADPDDTTVERYPGTLRAEREWTLYALFGWTYATETWHVEALQQGDAVLARAAQSDRQWK